MPFGGFCPLPLRLGGTDEYGVGAAQWQRLAGDMEALTRCMRLAVMIFDCDSSPNVVAYAGVNGVGIGSAPTITYVSTGTVDIEFDAIYENVHGEAREITILSASVQGNFLGGPLLINKGNITINDASSLRVQCFGVAGSPTNGRVTVIVYGMLGTPASVEDYGGSVDKRDCTTEKVPYAYTFYQEYTSALGSAFSQETTGYIHALKLAKARCRGAESRTAERFRCNAMPTLSGDTSQVWCRVMGVPYSSNTTAEFRRKLLKSRVAAARGPSYSAVDDAVEDLLGERLVQVHRYIDNALDDPPEETYWPTFNPGPSTLDIGGGAWMSQRSHVFVEVLEPSPDDTNYRELLDTHLARLLDTILPAHADFDWGSTDSSGFVLDVSLLDIDAL